MNKMKGKEKKIQLKFFSTIRVLACLIIISGLFNSRHHQTIIVVTDSRQQDKPKQQNRGIRINHHNEKYLLYLSHSGYSNQLIGIEKASYMAILTNRTLVLPPIIPHLTVDTKELSFPHYTYRTDPLYRTDPISGGDWTTAHYSRDILRVRRDLVIAGASELPFPSHKTILDFDVLMRNVRNNSSSSLKLIDMRDFAFNILGEGNIHRKDFEWCKMEGSAAKKMSKPSTFLQSLMALSRRCHDGYDIAIIGSAFRLPPGGEKVIDQPTRIAIENFFQQMPPTPRFKTLQREMFRLLSPNGSDDNGGYVGVHVRFWDNMEISNDCQRAKDVYQSILGELRDYQKNNSNNGERITVLVGDSHPAALRCFEYFDVENEFIATTTSAILKRNPNLQRKVEELPVENSTIYAVLDQAMLALAKKFFFGAVWKDGFNGFYSTYQARIQSMQKHRTQILSRLLLDGGDGSS